MWEITVIYMVDNTTKTRRLSGANCSVQLLPNPDGKTSRGNVEIHDAEGKPVESFMAADCASIHRRHKP
jgi:hypothetical protein